MESKQKRTALVTGGSSGIGRCTAAALSKAGYIVYEFSRRDVPVEGVRHMRVDVTDEASVQAAVEQILRERGSIDILVNCAGFGISGAVEFTELKQAKAQFDVNFFGTVNVSRAVLPSMRRQHSGHIVNISSVAAVAHIPFQAFYSASKAAVSSYSCALDNEVSPYGVRVTAVELGDIHTGFTQARQKTVLGDDEYGGRISHSVSQMEKDELTYHVPVLLKESVDGMNIRPDGTYVDVTFGGAGHSREILSRLGEGGRLLGFDQDEDAERNIVDDPHFIFVRSNFRYLHNFLRYHDIEQVDAILADLGVSSHHFDESERGFSFRFDGDLDMRMNKRAGLTAADIVNTYEEERLANIFYLYGELKNSRKLASVIVKARNGQAIRTIGEFLEVIKPLFGREREKKELAKVFQALRIEVNQEMEALKEMLLAATEALKPGGRLVVITYHSLEDRMVKNIMKTGNVEGKAESDFFGNLNTPFRLVNNKVIVPDEAEIERNPRSRSAKLRIAEKK